MYRNALQRGFLSIFSSLGSKLLATWATQIRSGHIKRIIDEEVGCLIIEISGVSATTTYISCPADPRGELGIKLPFFVILVKSLKKYFTFEIMILDDKNMRRRFRMSNYQTCTTVNTFCTKIPIDLDVSWNQIQLDLANITRRAYGTNYIETVRVQIHANCRLSKIFFCDRLYTDEETPNDYKLFIERGPKNKAKQAPTSKKA